VVNLIAAVMGHIATVVDIIAAVMGHIAAALGHIAVVMGHIAAATTRKDACESVVRQLLRLPCASNASAASRVFCMRVATVIGPTPPGTGVIQLARFAASA
jgi:hypothetical protein